jgi:hypothetical protein
MIKYKLKVDDDNNFRGSWHIIQDNAGNLDRRGNFFCDSNC